MSVTEFIVNPRVRQWLPTVLNSAMLLLLVASLAQWTWMLVKPPLSPPVLAPPPPLPPANTFSLQPLLAAHLFGEVSQELVDRNLDNLPLSSLNLVVTGVIAASAGGYALISVNGQLQEPFAVGQTVTRDAVLQGVYSDRVIVRRNGALESLLLEGADNSRTPQDIAAPAVNRSAGTPAELIQETASNHYIEQRDQLVAPVNVAELLKPATLMPSGDGGVAVRVILPGSFYEKLRMRAGDVIKSVNGQPVNTTQDAIRLYQQMPSMGAVQIEIVRGGRSEFLHYQFAQK